jgi:hypothetical protein
MSQELILKSPLLTVQYATVSTNSGSTWNGSTFETHNPAHQKEYAILLDPQGVGNNYYTADFPIGNEYYDVPSGVYSINIYSQLSTEPESTDTLLVSGYYNWPGTDLGPASNWVTLASLKTYLGLSNSSCDALLTSLLTQASLALTNSLQRNPSLVFYLENQDGTGFSFLKTNSYPIVSLSSVTNLRNQNNQTVYPGSFFVYNQEGTIRWNPQSPSVPQSFAQGYQNYIVAYEGGYNTIPQDLQLACCMYTQFLFNYSKKDLTVTGKTAKDVSIQYGRSLMGDFTGNIFMPIEAILKRYRQISTL